MYHQMWLVQLVRFTSVIFRRNRPLILNKFILVRLQEEVLPPLAGVLQHGSNCVRPRDQEHEGEDALLASECYQWQKVRLKVLNP